MKNTIINLATITIFIAIFAIFGESQANAASLYNGVDITPGGVYEITDVGAAVTGKMTDFSFNDNSGKKHSILEVTKGKYAFLNFWGTWCPPCRKEIPDVIAIQEDLRNELVVIGVAFERDVAKAKINVAAFANANKMNYVLFVISDELKSKIVATYGGINSVPTTYLVNKNNEIFEKIVGSQSKDQFMASINKMKQ